MKHYLLALVIIIGAFVSTDAATLFGKVIEVNSGDVITIYNLNRPVRVKLMGVDAPEMNQAFGDVAKSHLTNLVFEKSVVVEYAGIAADSSLTGRVLLNDADIGAQMIRDGAAWFDPSNGRLNPSDRAVYQESEQAARSEKRGLWQQENPVAPWEFVRAAKMRSNPAPNSNEIVTETKPRRSGPVPELNNLTLMATKMNPAPVQPTAETNPWTRSAAHKNWSRFQAPGESFSVEIPEDGERLDTSIPMADQMVQLKGYRVRDGWAVYALSWFKAPSFGETDEVAFSGLIKDLTQGAIESGSGCKSSTQKDISQNGYTGVEVDMRSCKVPSIMRLYTRVVDNERQFYIGTALYSEEEADNVKRFLNSFTVGQAKRRTR